MAKEDTMDERTKVLISLGAATAANCVPCFQHYFGRANSVGLTPEEIQEAVDLASQVKKGAHTAMRDSISHVMDQKDQYEIPCSGPRIRKQSKS
jgi:alkylhydroperoxidase/carboxymuconolactone decarboxylase family protein YurZ